MAGDRAKPCELDQEKYDAEDNVKIICLGDSAVGKSKLMERFLMDGFQPQQLSTYALTLYKHTATVDGKTVLVDFWDTAGQERFQSMHASYYHKAHACIMVFDVQRKITYKNLSTWYAELREFRPEVPCIVVANKIDGGRQHFMGDPPPHASSSFPGATNLSILLPKIKPLVACHHFPSRRHKDDPKKLQFCQEVLPAPVFCLGCRWYQRREALQ
uniref:RAB, member of RAS oncogene family like 2B n=1 Tax=Equus caballus TaxID=9796 RepID=H9H034_HORSE